MEKFVKVQKNKKMKIIELDPIELINPTTFRVQNQKLFIRNEVQAASSLQVHPFGQDMKNVLPTFNCTNKQESRIKAKKSIWKGANHTIRKVKFLSKNSILTKLYNFLGKSKLSITKKCKSSTFSRVFQPNFFNNFSREIKVVNS